MLSSTNPGVSVLFRLEAGGHRFQRVPPTEKRGRIQSSTVTVSLSSEGPEEALQVGEVKETFCRGSGAGGQNRNKRDTCVVLFHPASGLLVREESQRTQEANRRRAWERLELVLKSKASYEEHLRKAAELKAQRGTGERADKIRTYQIHRDRAVDHRTNKECRWSDLEKGKLRLILT